MKEGFSNISEVMTVQKEMGERIQPLQEHKRFRQSLKLSLNLSSFRLLRPSRNLVSNFKPMGFCIL